MASASGSNGLVPSRICLWDVESGTCRATLKHHEHDVVAMSYSRDDRYEMVCDWLLKVCCGKTPAVVIRS